LKYDDWCAVADVDVGAHRLRLLTSEPARIPDAVAETAAAVPGHYAAEERIADILQRLGKPTAAKYVEGKLPTSKSIRSGDLGEILATEWIGSQGEYEVPIKRLRWKDHRNMAMRGDDVIGIHFEPETGELSFLKTEAKSRVALSAGVVTDARAGLDKEGGLPSAHALSFIADKLSDLGNEALADAILDASLKTGIRTDQVHHLIFTFSGNNPQPFLTQALQAYAGNIGQWTVGLRVADHPAFIGAVYDLVIANANN
jgi:hypothetical protein